MKQEIKENNSYFLSKFIKPEIIIIVMLIIVVIVGSSISKKFLDIPYLFDFLTIYGEFGIIAIAFTYLMVCGEIDLSIASNMGFTLCLIAVLYQTGWSIIAACIAGVLLATLLGFLNGVIVVLSKIPSLIITLGTMISYRGMAQVLIGENSISGFPDWFIRVDKKLVFGFLPLPILILLIIAIIMEIILKKTYFGRIVYAIGTSANVSLYSAFKVGKIKLLIFSLTGFFCGIAAVLTLSRLTLAKYTIGVGGELDIITMVLMGGTAFSGGRGSVLGTVFAFIVIVLIRSAMMLVNLGGAQQMMVLGLILIIVIIASTKIQKLEKQ